MNKYQDVSFEDVREKGFSFPGARAWIFEDRESGFNNYRELAQDAALITTPNTTVPVEFLAYIDPQVVEILTAPRKARAIFDEQKKGDWTTAYMEWEVDEYTGSTQPYSDYANGTTSGFNAEWPKRQQYVFQTSITYGDREVAVAGAAKVALAAKKQRGATTVIDIDSNKFALLGVAGREIYGILNDPNLPGAIVAAAVGEGSSTHWADKSTVQIYNDILALFAELSAQSKGLITAETPLKLCLSPGMSVNLGAATGFNVNVTDMINKYFSNIQIVTVPELATTAAGETVMLIAPEVNGTPTGFIGFSEKIRAGRVVPDMSSLRQKYISTTYGGVILQPFAIASMTGV